MLSDLSKIGDFAAKRAIHKYEVKRNAPDYKDFFVEAFKVIEPNTNYKHNWHIDYLCNVLQKETDRIAKGEPKECDIIINIMPRSLKSYLVTMLWNAWAWTKYPYLRFTTLSYSQPLSEEHSYKTREFLKSNWYQDNFGDVFNLSKSQDSKRYFTNDKSGERKASSVGGQLTGSGANILIFDDPVKPPKQGEYAISETELNECNSWHDSTAYNRVNDPLVDLRVYVMQRLHNNDLTGHLLKKKKQKYKLICIPGELGDNVNPPDLKKHYKVDRDFKDTKVFFRDRFPKSVLLNYEENMLDNYSGQVNQKPSTEGGNILKLDYFTKISSDDLPKKVNKSLCGWDLATGKKQKKNKSASAYTYGYRHNDEIFIVDYGYVWKEFPQLIKYIKSKPAPHWIEDKSAGQDAVPELQAHGVEAHSYPNNNQDKFQKAAMAASKVKRLKVYVLDTIWDEFLGDNNKGKEQGICEFPNAVWDDLLDSFCIFIDKISEGIITISDIQEMAEINRHLKSKSRVDSIKEIRQINSWGRSGSFSGHSI